MKRYIGYIRDQADGPPLTSQEKAIRQYARANGGSMKKIFRVRKGASKIEWRKTFNELIAFAREHAAEIEGILFYQVRSVARNLCEFVALESLENDLGVTLTSIAVPR